MLLDITADVILILVIILAINPSILNVFGMAGDDYWLDVKNGLVATGAVITSALVIVPLVWSIQHVFLK